MGGAETRMTKTTVKSRKGEGTKRAPLEVTKPGEVGSVKGTLFGPPKTGKTTGAVSGSGKKLLVLTEPEGDLSLTGRTDVDVVRPTNYKELEYIVRELHSGGQDAYDTVVFDSVTFMAEVIGGTALFKVMQENSDPRRTYMKVGGAVNQIIRDTVALANCNVIFIAQLKSNQPGEDGVPLNPEEGEYELSLAVQPMIYKILSPAVSFMGRTFKSAGYSEPEEGKPRNKIAEYWVSFEDYGKSPAGSRIPVPDRVKNFNLDSLLKN